MRAVESQWWIIELPEEWDAVQDEDVIIISDEDDVGEIVLTTLTKEQGPVKASELSAFTEETAAQFGPPRSVQVGEFSGLYFSFEDEGDALREWYLYCDNLLLFITYSCDLDNAGMDDGIVDEILGTLFIKEQGDEEAQ